jgi:hypothetical protein
MYSRPLSEEPLLTPKQAAAKLSMSVKTLMEHVRTGRLRYIDIGSGGVRKRHRFTTYNLQTFIENQKVREVPKCLSTSAPTSKHTASTFKSGVTDFQAIPKPETKKTLKLSNAS